MKNSVNMQHSHFPGWLFSAFLMLLTIFSIAPTTRAQEGNVRTAKPDIFYMIKMTPGGVPANTPTTIRIEAMHYGRPIVSIPCTYEFFVINSETGDKVSQVDDCNGKRVTIPSNSGRLDSEFRFNLPQGQYAIYFNYLHSMGSEGPLFFSTLHVGEAPPTPQTAEIKFFYLFESWLTRRSGYNSDYYGHEYGQIDHETGTITVDMEHWHTHLSEAEAQVELKGGGSFVVNGVTYENKDVFTADFTEPFSMQVISEDGTVTKDYTVTVNNSIDGHLANMSWGISFDYYDRKGLRQNAYAELNPEKNEFIMQLPTQVWDIGPDGFSGSISPSFGATVAIDGNELGYVSRYDSFGRRSYLCEFSHLAPADVYTITVTSPDGTVTNEYTVRLTESVVPVIWFNEPYCTGIRYYHSPWDNIETAIPLEWINELSIYLDYGFLEENSIQRAELMIRNEQHNIMFPAGRYPTEDPNAEPNEIRIQSYGMELSPGEYELVLLVEKEPNEEYPWPMGEEFILAGITLTDDPVYYVNHAVFANGNIMTNKYSYLPGEEVSLTLWGITEGYELASLNIYKTGDEQTKVPFEGTGNGNHANRTFTMPAYHVNIVATFQKKSPDKDDETVLAAKAAVLESAFVFTQAETATEAALQTVLTARINSIISSFGITITETNIVLHRFEPATHGEDGNFEFMVTISKGSASHTAVKDGIISATAAYAVTLGSCTGGSLSADPSLAAAGETIGLTISPESGYVFEAIHAYKTLDQTIPVTLEGSGNSRSFTMPAYGVTVEATFLKTQAQIDKEAVEATQQEIEQGTFQIAAIIAQTKENIRTWIIHTLKTLLGENHAIVFRSDNEPLVGEVAITAFTPAINGTASNPKGTNGSFTFTVTLHRGETTLKTLETSGVIQATSYTTPSTPPEKQIRLQSTEELKAVLSNTGEVATGKLTLELSGKDADAFTLSTLTIDNLAVAEKAEIRLIPLESLSAGEYKMSLTVSGSGLDPATIHFVYAVTATGTDGPQPENLRVYVQNETLYISGLPAGQSYRIYTLSGILLCQDIAGTDEVKVNLPARGVYIVKTDRLGIKVVY